MLDDNVSGPDDVWSVGVDQAAGVRLPIGPALVDGALRRPTVDLAVVRGCFATLDPRVLIRSTSYGKPLKGTAQTAVGRSPPAGHLQRSAPVRWPTAPRPSPSLSRAYSPTAVDPLVWND